MDIQKLITEVLGKLNNSQDLVAKFKKDPVGTVKSLLSSLDLDMDTIKKIVEGVSAKLGVEDVAKEATGFLAKLKKFFGK
ncbi:MAG: hypothetical protein IKP40_03330 [Clostridia bacterium]|nr:hypothetical protein [Clostridia bacterium]